MNGDSNINILVNDINICISIDRVDKMIYYFLHIYELLDDDLKSQSLRALKKDIDNFLASKDKLVLLDLFYKVYDSDASEFLLDNNTNDEDIYKLDRYRTEDGEDIYMFIFTIKKRIVTELGKVKKMLIAETMPDLNL